jgi:hypothetical protein
MLSTEVGLTIKRVVLKSNYVSTRTKTDVDRTYQRVRLRRTHTSKTCTEIELHLSLSTCTEVELTKTEVELRATVIINTLCRYYVISAIRLESSGHVLKSNNLNSLHII